MAAQDPVRVGLVGCGNISGIYLKNARTLPHIEIVACSDLEPERAAARAAEFPEARPVGFEEMLADPEIEIVLNLTVPTAHAEVTLAALAAGKHVYCEKPLATTIEDGRRILLAADEQKRLVGCAPDTFFGSGLQTARSLIDSGAIGVPVGATAFFLSRGQEHWHPNPQFFYQPGAGPLFDMGPYYLTALVALLGGIRAVASMARISFPERTISSQPLAGTTFTVGTPTYVAALLDFCSGPVGTLISTFDVHHHSLPHLEIYGSEGTLLVPNPNNFGGSVRLRRGGEQMWTEASSDSPYVSNHRGLGLDDMARAVREGGDYRASGRIAFHVLEAMESILDSAGRGGRIDLASTADRPDPLPVQVSLKTTSQSA